MATFWQVFTYILLFGFTVGFLWYAAYQIRYTFFLPPFEEAVYTEKFVKAKRKGSAFQNRAHIVVTGDELILSMCRMFYRYQPRDTTVHRISLDSIGKMEWDPNEALAMKIWIKEAAEPEWRVSSRNSKSLLW